MTVRVPVLSLLFSDSLIAVTFSVTVDPAGMTTWPDASFTSFATVAPISSPALFLWERISAVVAATIVVPGARLRPAAAAGAWLAGAPPDGRDAEDRGRAADGAPAADGRSFNGCDASVG